ncbi:MAG: ABC transporter permease [Bacteroidetes bacterium]|nr:ABC transporter permease [Bacteroidota bacterium]
MGRFIVMRIFYGVLVLLGTATVVFLLFNVLPGDPARMMLGQHADAKSIEIINKDLNRDKPLFIQYLLYMNDLSPLSVHNEKNKEAMIFLHDDKYAYTKLFNVGRENVLVLKYPYFRRSYQNKTKVADIIKETLPETVVLAVASILVASFIGIFVGVFSAIYKDTWFDKSSLVFAILWMSGPSFYIGLILAYLFGHVLSEYTQLNFVGSLFVVDDYGNGEYLELKNLLLPAITLGLRPLAIIIQLTRSSMLDVLSHDYIRTASAKGLAFYSVMFKHALKNALSPVMTAISGSFAAMMAGSVFVEEVFNWKGIGKETVYALQKHDMPVVMGTVLVIAAIFVIINTLVDVLYGILDPRVRVK